LTGLSAKRSGETTWPSGCWQYASHAKPFPYKVETLRDMSGSIATVKDFKQKLKSARRTEGCRVNTELVD
jgi:hypothetical protein